MILLSPAWLWLLLGVAALAVGYVVSLRRRSRYAVRFTNFKLLDRVAPRTPAWRRHVPAVLFLVLLSLATVGLAGPQTEELAPREEATVMVAVDISGSMLATDVAPNRLESAKQAARTFVDDLPARFRVGLVNFAGTASLVVPPSTDRSELTAAIDGLVEDPTGRGGTAIGDAIAMSMSQIREAGEEDAPPARIVVLSDGANTSGQDPAEATVVATEYDVPVDTISFGTAEGMLDRSSGRTGNPLPVPVDGESLRAVAQETGGQYYEAGNADELRDAYSDIGSLIGYHTVQRDISDRFIGAALVVAVLIAVSSLLWFARLP